MNQFEKLQLHILDQHIQGIQVCDAPSKGWIKAIRNAIGMTAAQLGVRLGISQQSVVSLEENEARDSITLSSLRRAAEGMDCRLVYALVPNKGSLENTIKNQARIRAMELLQAVDHSMKLEMQGVGHLEEKILELTENFSKHPNSKLWESNEVPLHRGTDTSRSRRKT